MAQHAPVYPQLVIEKNGIDYLVVYVNEETKQQLFFIDQLNQEMLAREHNEILGWGISSTFFGLPLTFT